MFFSDGKLSITERTSEKKEKTNLKCLFEGHLTKLKQISTECREQKKNINFVI